MKKYLVVLLVSLSMVMSGLYVNSFAKDNDPKKSKKTAIVKKDKKEKKSDKAEKKEKKVKKDKDDKSVKGEKKEKKGKKGKVEKDIKADKKEAKAAKNKNTDDKVIGKDDKGRTIYEGPRGGQYYINSNGNKTYLKKDKKM